MKLTPLEVSIPNQEQGRVLRVVLFGAESTGKTTLSRQLAEYYQTEWVPEFAREYSQKKWDNEQEKCELKDVLPIVVGQLKSENELVKMANKILICDTNILETKVYSEIYYKFVPKELTKAIEKTTYHLYLLTYIDTPWVADDLRDKPNEREQMFKSFENELIIRSEDYVLLKGGEETRFKKAVKVIDEFLGVK